MLLVLCLVAMLAAAGPAMAEETEGEESEEDTCVKIYLKDPRVIASPQCLRDQVESLIR